MQDHAGQHQDHELLVLCLVAEDRHAQEGTDPAACQSQEGQGLLGDPPVSPDSFSLIGSVKDKSCEIDDKILDTNESVHGSPLKLSERSALCHRPAAQNM